MRGVDKYLAKALEYITDNLSLFSKPGSSAIQKAYKGYVASFGTIVKQSGLLPAVVLFSKSSEDDENTRRGDASKRPIVNAIYAMLQSETNLVDAEDQPDLVSFAQAHQNSSLARREVIYAAIALKLAMRTFEIEK
ncbi:MAG: hypothetical protein KDC44_11215 [Phaeodactylibacter sp.]|nr:hypothetical protein [Phaeodactylibacter sp.]